MKNLNRIIACSLITLATAGASFAQNAEAGMSSDMPRLSKANAPSVASASAEMVIDFVNTGEKSVAIFAGPKENIRNPRIETYGGLSKYQKFYLKENEVVCIMAPDKSPKACTIIKAGNTKVEVNSTGNGIVAK